MKLSLLSKILPATAAVVVILSCPLSSIGAVANVSVNSNDTFSPSTTSINVGDTVVWTWGSGSANHNVVSTSATRAWLFPNTGGTTSNQNNTNLKNNPFVFTNTFTSAGSFPYECTEHVSFGMVGTINVAAVANQPPAVTITNPASGAVLSAPASVTIQASASDSDGTVTNVQFLVGATVLANITTAPFSAVTNNLAAGSYTFSAVASDNFGATATNSTTISVVTPVQTALNALQFLNATNFQFSYAANVGLSYVVQLSTNLASAGWIALATNAAASNPVVFVDSHATNNPGFYRVGRLPNP
jgi:plastocyanin